MSEFLKNFITTAIATVIGLAALLAFILLLLMIKDGFENGILKVFGVAATITLFGTILAVFNKRVRNQFWDILWPF